MPLNRCTKRDRKNLNQRNKVTVQAENLIKDL